MSEKLTQTKRFPNGRSMTWLRERREKLGLSQDDLMARLQIEGVDVSRGTISNWENSKHKMPLNDDKFRLALARVLRLPEKEILKSSGYDIGQRGHSDDAERAADIVDSLPPQQQKLALRLLEQLAQPE